MNTENTNLSELANQKANGKKNFFELIRFVIVGGMSTVVDLVVTTVLVFTTALNANFITTIAFLTAFLVSFFGHRYFQKERLHTFLFCFSSIYSNFKKYLCLVHVTYSKFKQLSCFNHCYGFSNWYYLFCS